MDNTEIKEFPMCTSNRQQPAPGKPVGTLIFNLRRVYTFSIVLFLTLLQPNSSQVKPTVSGDMKHPRIVLRFDPNCNISVTFQMNRATVGPVKPRKEADQKNIYIFAWISSQWRRSMRHTWHDINLGAVVMMARAVEYYVNAGRGKWEKKPTLFMRPTSQLLFQSSACPLPLRRDP